MFKTLTSAIDIKKKPTAEEIQKIPPFLFCKWLSGNPHTILAANQLNYYYDIPIENQYYMIKNVFAGKIKYIPYPKKESADQSKNVQYLIQHFKISEEKAQEYLTLISDEELQTIINMYDNF